MHFEYTLSNSVNYVYLIFLLILLRYFMEL